MYQALGQAVLGLKKIMIAVMDLVNNDLPEESNVEVTRFPTLYYYRAKDKQNPIVYAGDRSVPAFLEFIQTVQSVYTQDELKKWQEEQQQQRHNAEGDHDAEGGEAHQQQAEEAAGDSKLRHPRQRRQKDEL